MSNHRTAKSYWDNLWQNDVSIASINPHDLNIGNYVNRSFHNYFTKLFTAEETKGLKLLELGCANSRWLPYFGKEFGFELTGLDYSEIGCDLTRRNLQSHDLEGDVVCADLFSPPQNMLNEYDVVVSFGVAEHFDDTSRCIEAMSQFVKSGGLLFTNIPNMSGYVGAMQKLLNKPVYDIHNPLNVDQFQLAHETVCWAELDCSYFMSTNFGVCNLNGVPRGKLKWLVKKTLLAFLVRVSMLVWVVERRRGSFDVKQAFSPYINCLAKKI